MGNQGKLVLVVMTNGDVAYLTADIAEELVQVAAEPTPPRIFETVDAKTNKELRIFIDHISTIVEGGRNA